MNIKKTITSSIWEPNHYTNMSINYRNIVTILVLTQSVIVLTYIAILQMKKLPNQSPSTEQPDSSHPENISALSDKMANLPLFDLRNPGMASRLRNVTVPHGVSVAVGLALTTVNAIESNMTRLPFLNTLLVSFCETASPGFTYNFYVAYDYDDHLLSKDMFRKRLTTEFNKYISLKKSHCPRSSAYYLHYVRCNHRRKPAWAQNDAMLEAYLQGNDYFFRVNDDTRMVTPSWTETFIRVLLTNSPPNVGVVGPNHIGGNQLILTYDFVHRSHIELFGFYYPREYSTWYGDHWITRVYLPGRATKVKSIVLKHTRTFGRRYNISKISRQTLQVACDRDRDVVIRYVSALEQHTARPNPYKVIAMVIWDNETHAIWGAVRNAQLRRTFFPDWTMRIYVVRYQYSTMSKNYSKNLSGDYNEPAGGNITSVKQVTQVLKSLGAEVRTLKADRFPPAVPRSFWNVLIADDPTVQVFLVRHADTRFSQREVYAVNDWLARDTALHCIRDHPSHGAHAIPDGLWGAKSTQLRQLLKGETLESLVNLYVRSYTLSKSTENNTSFANSFLSDVIWPRMEGAVICHDSVACNMWPLSCNFPNRRTKLEYVGSKYTSHERVIGSGKDFILEHECPKGHAQRCR